MLLKEISELFSDSQKELLSLRTILDSGVFNTDLSFESAEETLSLINQQIRDLELCVLGTEGRNVMPPELVEMMKIKLSKLKIECNSLGDVFEALMDPKQSDHSVMKPK